MTNCHCLKGTVKRLVNTRSIIVALLANCRASPATRGPSLQILQIADAPCVARSRCTLRLRLDQCVGDPQAADQSPAAQST